MDDLADHDRRILRAVGRYEPVAGTILRGRVDMPGYRVADALGTLREREFVRSTVDADGIGRRYELTEDGRRVAQRLVCESFHRRRVADGGVVEKQRFHCPSCRGRTVHAPAGDGWECLACGREQTPEEDDR